MPLSPLDKKSLEEFAATVAKKVATEAATISAKVALETSSSTPNLATDIKYIKEDISEIKASIKEQGGAYVTKIEFDPIKRLVYGTVSLILIAVVGALLALVIQR